MLLFVLNHKYDFRMDFSAQISLAFHKELSPFYNRKIPILDISSIN